ncbi:MAG: 2-deoxy-scyllo-inosose synthase [Pseudonocardiaceae bacterium]
MTATTTGHPVLALDSFLAHGCPFLLGDGIEEQLPQRLRAVAFDTAFLVTSRDLLPLHGNRLHALLTDAGIRTVVITVDERMGIKSWRALTDLCERLVLAGVTRDSLLIAFGGGTVSNLVGLAAGLVYRGVRFIDVPTTATALTDSSLSNKQAINGAAGKNQFGLYHAPEFIWSDVAYLRSEPKTQLRGAIVEALKNGLINDSAWFDAFSNSLDPDLNAVRGDLLATVTAMVKSKLPILQDDPGERGSAVILEYGHTVGHAVEWASEGRLPHGEAVSIGMCAAAHLGLQLGITRAEVLERQEYVLGERLGAPTRIPADLALERLMDLIVSDNKRRAGNDVQFIFITTVGRPHAPAGSYLTPVPRRAVLAALAGRGGSR